MTSATSVHEAWHAKLVFWDNPLGQWGGRWGGSGWGTHVNPWLIHVSVWQKPLQYCKVISLQLIKIIGKKTKIKRNKIKEKYIYIKVIILQFGYIDQTKIWSDHIQTSKTKRKKMSYLGLLPQTRNRELSSESTVRWLCCPRPFLIDNKHLWTVPLRKKSHWCSPISMLHVEKDSGAPLVGTSRIGTQGNSLYPSSKAPTLIRGSCHLLGLSRAGFDSRLECLWQQEQEMEAEGDIPATCPGSWDGAVGMGHLGHSWPAKGRGPQTGLWMALLNEDQVLDKDTPEGSRKIAELGPVDLYFWSYLCLLCRLRWTLWEYSCFSLSLPETEGWCGQTGPLHPSTCFTLLWSIWCFIVFVFTLCLPRLNFSNEGRGGWYIPEAWQWRTQ